MDVEDGLSGICICVHNETIAAIGDAFLRGKGFCGAEEMTDQGFVIHGHHVDRVNVLVGDDQNMGRRGGRCG